MAEIDYIAAWTVPSGLLRTLPSLKAVFSVGAGVDQLKTEEMPKGVLLVRTVEPNLVEEMVDYATLAVLALHRNLPDYLTAQRAGAWAPRPAHAKAGRQVGIMGLGEIGRAIADRLIMLGFPVIGWSNTPKSIRGAQCLSGPGALSAFLSASRILLCVLPLTNATSGILNKETFAMLPCGAGLINIGRGGHVDESALAESLAAGHIGAAVLDVAAVEPLPADHWLWSHPRILLTPHIAGTTNADGGARAIAAAIIDVRNGRKPYGAVDRTKGY